MACEVSKFIKFRFKLKGFFILGRQPASERSELDMLTPSELMMSIFKIIKASSLTLACLYLNQN